MSAVTRIKKTVATLLMMSVSSQMGWTSSPTSDILEAQRIETKAPANGIPVPSKDEEGRVIDLAHALISQVAKNVEDPFLAAATLYSVATFDGGNPNGWLSRVDSFLPLGSVGDALIPLVQEKHRESSLVALGNSLSNVNQTTITDPEAARNFLNAVKDSGTVALMAVAPFTQKIDEHVKTVAGDSLLKILTPLPHLASATLNFVEQYVYFAADGASFVAMAKNPQKEWSKFRESHNNSSASFMTRAGASIGFFQPLRFPLRLLSSPSFGALAPAAVAFRYEATLFSPLKVQLASALLAPYNNVNLLPEKTAPVVQELTRAAEGQIMPTVPFGAVAGAMAGAVSFALGGAVTIEPLVGTLIAPGEDSLAERIIVGAVSTEAMRATLGQRTMLEMGVNVIGKLKSFIKTPKVAEAAGKAAVEAPKVAEAAVKAVIEAPVVVKPYLTILKETVRGSIATTVRSYVGALKETGNALIRSLVRTPKAVASVGAVTLAATATTIAIGGGVFALPAMVASGVALGGTYLMPLLRVAKTVKAAKPKRD